MTSRRTFLQSAAALPFAFRAFGAPTTAPAWVLLGTDNGKGIYRARWNSATGEIGKPELAITADRPDYFATHPALPVMYSVNSVGKGKGEVSSFTFDRATAELKLLNKVSSHGDGPCFVATDGKWAYAANYSSGSFAAYGVNPDGSLQDYFGVFTCKISGEACGIPGPVRDRQDGAHLHCTTIAPSGHVIVCDLGDDSLLVFNPPKIGVLTPQKFSARKGSGPRHVAFHPNGKWMYCIHELDCTIDLFDWSVAGTVASLTLRENSVISTLAPGVTAGEGAGRNTACEILISPDGQFAYACTRFVDEITVYRIDPKTGLLTEQQRLTAGGRIPRIIAFDPSRRWLVACNQGLGPNPMGNLAVFAHDPATGHIDPKPQTFAADTPMFIQWL